MLADSELVIGLVSPVGTDIQRAMDTLKSELSQYGYEPYEVHVSELFPLLSGEDQQVDTHESEYKRIKRLIKQGNDLRREYDACDVLAFGVVSKIEAIRQEMLDFPRRAYIVNSLKRPEEVTLLRSIYGDGFYLISVLSDQEKGKHSYRQRWTLKM